MLLTLLYYGWRKFWYQKYSRSRFAEKVKDLKQNDVSLFTWKQQSRSKRAIAVGKLTDRHIPLHGTFSSVVPIKYFLFHTKNKSIEDEESRSSL